MSVQDEHGRHAYDEQRDDEGNLRTNDGYPFENRDSDDVVQGETLLPVDSEDERREDDPYGEPRESGYVAGDGVVEGETVAEHTVTYDSATGEPVEEVYSEETVAGDAAYTDEPVLVGGTAADGEAVVGTDDGVADGSVGDDDVAGDDVAGDSVSDDAVGDDVVGDDVVADDVADDSVADDVVADDVVAAPVDSTVDSTDTAADEPSWLDLKGLFVDDPAGAVAGAASKVDAAIAALRDKGTSDTDTEQLRLAFRRYQEIHKSLTES